MKKSHSEVLAKIRKHNLVEHLLANEDEIRSEMINEDTFLPVPIFNSLMEENIKIVANLALDKIEREIHGVLYVEYDELNNINVFGTNKAMVKWEHGMKHKVEKILANYFIASSNYVLLDKVIDMYVVEKE